MATPYSSVNELTFADLKKNSGITDAQLDQKVDRKQLRNLASLFGSWEEYVETPGLDLRKGQVADLREYYSKHDNELTMFRALKLWYDRNPYVTYRALIGILLSLHQGVLADLVCRTLTVELAKASEPDESEASQPASLPTDQPALPTPEDHDEQDSSSLVKLDEQPALPTPKPHKQDNSSSADQPTLEHYERDCSSVADHIKKFEERFVNLRITALRELTDKGITVKDFRHILITLPKSISDEHQDYILQNHSFFEEARSIEKIFVHLNFYLSYIDFSLLEHIIDKLGSDHLKRDMRRYAQDMKQFRMETTIKEVIPHLPQKSSSQQLTIGYSILEVKANIDVCTSTLEYLDSYRKQFASEFLLSQFVLLLSDIKESSLLITWLVPYKSVQPLKKRIQEKDVDVFLKLDVLKLTLTGERLYPPRIKQADKTTFSSPSPTTSTKGRIKSPRKTSSTVSMMGIVQGRAITSDNLGLAIILDIADSSGIEKARHQFSDTLADIFGQLKFSVFKESGVTKKRLTRVFRNARKYLKYTHISPKTLVVVVTGAVHRDINNLLPLINVSCDIMRPLFVPNLVAVPKVFLVYSLSEKAPLVTSKLSVRSQGNFIISYVNMPADYRALNCIAEFLRQELPTQRETIENVLRRVKDLLPPEFSNTIISRLVKPLYLNSESPPTKIGGAALQGFPAHDWPVMLSEFHQPSFYEPPLIEVTSIASGLIAHPSPTTPEWLKSPKFELPGIHTRSVLPKKVSVFTPASTSQTVSGSTSKIPKFESTKSPSTEEVLDTILPSLQGLALDQPQASTSLNLSPGHSVNPQASSGQTLPRAPYDDFGRKDLVPGPEFSQWSPTKPSCLQQMNTFFQKNGVRPQFEFQSDSTRGPTRYRCIVRYTLNSQQKKVDSGNFYWSKADAKEQVAKLVLSRENTGSIMVIPGPSTKTQPSKLSVKSKLKEYCDMKGYKSEQMPKYSTVPTTNGFISTVHLHDGTYRGEVCKSKWQAEQSAAFHALQYLCIRF